MGKSGAVGRSLVKNTKTQKNTFSNRHTTTIHEDFSRLPIRSVTEETSLNEFFSIAKLSNSDFAAQKKTFRFLDKHEVSGVVSQSDRQKSAALQDSYQGFLKIPRRPKWNKTMTNEELIALEQEELLNWRRTLARLEQTEGIMLTPFEKNLEFWRQLWRVVERSDLLVQIVDARQPLLYYNKDLETYAKEVDPNKRCVLLVNKSDFLTEEQRQVWAEYFQSVGIRAIFWSATKASGCDKNSKHQTADVHQLNTVEESCEEERSDGEDEELDEYGDSGEIDPEDDETGGGSDTDLDYSTANETDTTKDDEDIIIPGRRLNDQDPVVLSNHSLIDVKPISTNALPVEMSHPTVVSANSEYPPNSARIVDADELLDLFVTELYPPNQPRLRPPQLTVGFVGYPNVGKSSTLNSLMGCKKTSVSSTPGKTKHFQTLVVRSDLILCDCPGLVMPSFVHSKADLVVAGILSIDEMRDCLSPIGLVCAQIPRNVLEFKYGIDLSRPKSDCALDCDHDAPPTPHELLAAHAFMHGFMTAKGNPNYDRSARLILKDYVQGALLYCHPPPNTDSKSFQFLGRSTNFGLPPSLTYAESTKLSKFYQNREKRKNNSKARNSTDPANLILEFDRLAFAKTSQNRVHVRSRKQMLHLNQAESMVNRDPDAAETESVLSSSSWVTTETVGGSFLLSGTESVQYNWTGTTGLKKPWRLMSQSKRLNTVRPDPAVGDGSGHSRKRREKLRRVYVHLDQHEKT